MDRLQFFQTSTRKRRIRKKSAWKSDSTYRKNSNNRTHIRYPKAWINDNDSQKFTSGFYAAIGTTMVFAQFLGIMPVTGVKQGSPAKLGFEWTSFRCIYSMIVAFAGIAYAILHTWQSFKQRITFNTCLGVAFFSTTALGVCRFILIARQWPRLMQQWEFVEAILAKLRKHKTDRQLAVQIQIISFITIAVLVVEHSLNVAVILFDASVNKPDKDPLNELFETQLPFVFTYTDLTWWKAIIGKWFNIILTFVWSYTDLFVILVSIGLSTLFKRINRDLERHRSQHMDEKFWIMRRIQYRKVCVLVRAVDEIITPTIFVALAVDLLFICSQLHNSLHQKPSIVHGIYFWFSFGFLISRTLALSLYSAEINGESKKPIDIIRDVPRHSFTMELVRFTEEVVNDDVALSGMQFFFLTRKLILSVVGTIITYELVLLQFDDT